MAEDLFEVVKGGKTFAMTPQTLVAELTYTSYAFNRRRSPDLSVEGWRKVFGDQTDAMEVRFQHETRPPQPTL